MQALKLNDGAFKTDSVADVFDESAIRFNRAISMVANVTPPNDNGLADLLAAKSAGAKNSGVECLETCGYMPWLSRGCQPLYNAHIMGGGGHPCTAENGGFPSLRTQYPALMNDPTLAPIVSKMWPN